MAIFGASGMVGRASCANAWPTTASRACWPSAARRWMLALPLKATMWRPGLIVPMHGEVSKTPGYRRFYALLGPLLRVTRGVLPKSVATTTEQLGRAMIAVARDGSRRRVLESADINAL